MPASSPGGGVFKLQYQTNCFNITKAWSDSSERNHVFRVYQGWIALGPALFALLLTALYIVATVRAIRAHRVSRKFHALLVNRAIGDFFACTAITVLIAYIFLVSEVSYFSTNWTQFLNSMFTACFWSCLVTYTSIGFLKLYGIARPLQYKKAVTKRRCLLLIKLSWIFFVLIVLATMGFTLVVKIEFLANLTGCKVENCLTWMYRVRTTFTSLLYFTTLLCFVVSVALIKKAKRISGALGSSVNQRQSARKRFKFPLIKLTMGVATFALFHFPYTVWSTGLLFADNCYYLVHFNLMQTLQGFVRLFILLRIILDDLIGFYLDAEIRRELINCFRFCMPTKPHFVSQSSSSHPKVSSTTNSGATTESTGIDEKSPAAEKGQRGKRGVSVKMAAEVRIELDGLQQPRRYSEQIDRHPQKT